MGLFDGLNQRIDSADSATACADAGADALSFDRYVRAVDEVEYKVLDSVTKASFRAYVVARYLERLGCADLASPLYSASDVKNELHIVWHSIPSDTGKIIDPRTRQMVPISDYEDIAEYSKTYFEVFGKPGPNYMGEGDSYEQFETAKQSFRDAVDVVLSALQVLPSANESGDKRARDYYMRLLREMLLVEVSLQVAHAKVGKSSSVVFVPDDILEQCAKTDLSSFEIAPGSRLLRPADYIICVDDLQCEFGGAPHSLEGRAGRRYDMEDADQAALFADALQEACETWVSSLG